MADHPVNGKKKKRRMMSLKINEISGVDRPAQVGAVALLMKRDTVTKSMRLTNDVDGHAHLLGEAEIEGTAGHTSWTISGDDEFSHAHPWLKNSDGSIIIGAAAGHTHRLRAEKRDVDMTKHMEEQRALLSKSGLFLDDGDKDMATETDTAAEELTKANEKLEKSNARLEAINKMAPDHRVFFDGLEGEGADTFLAKNEGLRTAQINKAGEADQIVYTADNGAEFRKSDDPRLAKMAKESDERENVAKAEREKFAKADLEKRAGESLSHLPGELDTKVALLKAIDGIKDEDTRKGVLETLKAADTAGKGSFTRHGTSDVGKGNDTGEGGGDVNDELETLAKKYATENKVDIVKARDAVLKTPEGTALYANLPVGKA